MFNNIIYFIIVLLLYNISYPGSRPETPWFVSVALLFVLWLLFALYCKVSFKRLLERSAREEDEEPGPAALYQGLVFRLSIVAIVLFAVNVWFLHLKYWLQALPGLGRLSAVHGLLAMTVFIFYLAAIWFFGHPVYAKAFRTRLKRASFVVSNIRFNVPILFPWFFLSLIYDVLHWVPWPSFQEFLVDPQGQMVFFALFLGVLIVFMPRLIQSWWGCEPFPATEKAEALREFLAEKEFRYRRMLKWPIFGGRMLTAGIMGVAARYRYILVTESLMETLSIEELKSVVAHEMGHAKYRHLLFYFLFFLGFMVLSFGLFDVFLYFLAAHPFFVGLLHQGDGRGASLFYLVLTLPVLLTMVLYFRYVMGFFMRHFERQADLYSAQVLGSPRQIISSLEKIAALSGKIRDLPSWHHFSIRQRVDLLWRTTTEPGLRKKHNRFVASTLIVYLVCIVGLGYFLHFGPLKEGLLLSWTERSLQRQIQLQPEDVRLYLNLAMVYHAVGKEREAMETYDRIIRLDPDNALALNNLAWLLATAEDRSLRDKGRSLVLAERAVALERSAVYLDTLAEAYFVNGKVREAVRTIREALAVAEDDKAYYERQLRRFQEKKESG